jgi:hypothetical protein
MWQTEADIDQDLVPLIQTLWRAGFTTCFCCQGEAARSGQGEPLAYIKFSTKVEAALFAAMAGPFHWDRRTHQQRHQERPAGSERGSWDWLLEGDRVRFPSRDIARVTVAAARLPRLEALIQTPIPLRPAPPACPHCGLELIGALVLQADAHQAAPRRCPTCDGVVLSRRKDARYCSRRCQLAARDRRNKPEG